MGAILTFGCGTPFQLLIHNELPADADITVRWSQTYQGKVQPEDKTVFVPKGRAEEAFVWYGPPDGDSIVFLYQLDRKEHRIHVPLDRIPPGAYHAYVGVDRVRFAGRDWMDSVHLNLTSYMAPCWWACILAALAPPAIALRRMWRRRRGELPQSG